MTTDEFFISMTDMEMTGCQLTISHRIDLDAIDGYHGCN